MYDTISRKTTDALSGARATLSSRSLACACALSSRVLRRTPSARSLPTMSGHSTFSKRSNVTSSRAPPTAPPAALPARSPPSAVAPAARWTVSSSSSSSSSRSSSRSSSGSASSPPCSACQPSRARPADDRRSSSLKKRSGGRSVASSRRSHWCARRKSGQWSSCTAASSATSSSSSRPACESRSEVVPVAAACESRKPDCSDRNDLATELRRMGLAVTKT
mmetsp:Transcript_76996/g.231029  ORF Transcript_76996/g.231029 Transcript_76996/m.231029 type:complete len:221 (+) Transcript_76996:4789-5451(+)